MRGTKSESVPIEFVEDTMLYALFKPCVETQPKPRGRANRHCSSRTTDIGDNSRVRKKKRMDLEVARRVSLEDEKDHKIWAREIAFEASSSLLMKGDRIKTDCVEIDVGTTWGDKRTDVAGSMKPEPPTC